MYQQDKDQRHVLTLLVNPSLPKIVVEKFEASIYLSIICDGKPKENKILTVKYTGSGEYEAKASFVKQDVVNVRYELDSIVLIGQDGQRISMGEAGIVNPLIAGTLKDLLLLKQQVQFKRYT